MTDSLDRFVHDALAHGLGKDEIRAKLSAARWGDDEITAALAAYADVDSPVPVVLTGSPVGVREGGILDQTLREIVVRALPDELPDALELDVSELAVGDTVNVSHLSGLGLLAIGFGAGLVYWKSAVYQGETSAACINLVAKKPEEMGRAIILPVLVETYAVFAFLAAMLGMMWVAAQPTLELTTKVAP